MGSAMSGQRPSPPMCLGIEPDVPRPAEVGQESARNKLEPGRQVAVRQASRPLGAGWACWDSGGQSRGVAAASADCPFQRERVRHPG